MSPAAAADGARRPLLQRTLLWLWHELRVGVPIALVASTFISVMFDDPFVRTLIYSLCIGLSIQLLIEAGRYGLAAWLLRQGADSASLREHWPGWTVDAAVVHRRRTDRLLRRLAAGRLAHRCPTHAQPVRHATCARCR